MKHRWIYVTSFCDSVVSHHCAYCHAERKRVDTMNMLGPWSFKFQYGTWITGPLGDELANADNCGGQ